MTNKTIKLISICIFFLSITSETQATPLIYTFKGKVYGIIDNMVFHESTILPTGEIFYYDIFNHEKLNIYAGNDVEYKILIDNDLPATVTMNNGNIITNDSVSPYGDRSNLHTSLYNFFYTDYISGAMMHSVNGGYFNTIEEYNSGIFKGYSLCVVGDPNNYLQINGNGFVTNWVIGDYMISDEIVYSDTGHFTDLYSQLILTDISPVCTSVPEPTSIILFSVGLIGSATLYRKKCASSAEFMDLPSKTKPRT